MWEKSITNKTFNSLLSGTTHSVRFEEEFAFASWMNRELGGDPDLVKILPINEQDGSLYEKMKDGILLWSVPHIYPFINSVLYAKKHLLSIPSFMNSIHSAIAFNCSHNSIIIGSLVIMQNKNCICSGLF